MSDIVSDIGASSWTAKTLAPARTEKRPQPAQTKPFSCASITCTPRAASRHVASHASASSLGADATRARRPHAQWWTRAEATPRHRREATIPLSPFRVSPSGGDTRFVRKLRTRRAHLSDQRVIVPDLLVTVR